jgi:dolichol-phosphate mannosyltransferase
MHKILVTPIAFNEHVKIKNTIERFLASSAAGTVDYLVLNDGSTDETTAIIEGFAARGVRTIRHDVQRGVGAAIRTAIRYAIANKYTILVVMAGNDKDNPDEILSLVEPIMKADRDLVQGSRYKGGDGAQGDMPLYRRFATRLHPFLFSLFVGQRVTDSTNGFRAIKLSLFQDARINLDQPWLDHYELEPYILFKAITLGYRFQEVFVTKRYPAKRLGYTKMKPIVGWWSILKPIFYLGFKIKR